MKDDDIKTRVEGALSSIRNYLLADGGDVCIVEIGSNHSVVLKFLGNCRHCPMSETTFKNGIEQTIRSAVPEVENIKIV